MILGVQQALADLRAGSKECAAKGVLLRDGYQQQLTSTEQSYNDAVNSYKRLETLRGTNPEVFKDGEGDFERSYNALQAEARALLRSDAAA